MKKLLALLLVLVCLLTACSAGEKLVVGTWTSHETVLGVVTETTYVFNEDGTGTIKSVLPIDFTYTLTDGVLAITVTTLGIASTEEYECEFGINTLTLTNDSKTIKLEKQK